MPYTICTGADIQGAYSQETDLLNERIVKDFAALQCLRRLEISGESLYRYDPRVLGKLPQLESLGVRFPDNGYFKTLTTIVKDLDQRPTGGLKALKIYSVISVSLGQIDVSVADFRGIWRNCCSSRIPLWVRI